MKEYDITITEYLKRTITVQAQSKEAAEDLVHDEWSSGKHVLDSSDFDSATIEMKEEREINNVINAIYVEPMQKPVEIQIENRLKALQSAVGGIIQTAHYFDDPIEVICNEEGKISGLELNRAIYDSNGTMIDIVAGPFLIIGSGEEDFESLPKELIEKYSKKFEKPEKFYQLAGSIIVKKIDIPQEKDVSEKFSIQER